MCCNCSQVSCACFRTQAVNKSLLFLHPTGTKNPKALLRRDLDAWAWRGIVNVNTTDATTGATDCAEGRDPLHVHVHVKYLKLLGTRNACSTLGFKNEDAHSMGCNNRIIFHIHVCCCSHTLESSTLLERQASNVECGAQPHPSRRSQPATPTAMPTRQIRPGALGLLTPPCSVPWEPVRNDSAGPGRRAAFRSSRRATARGRIDMDNYPAPPAGSRAVGVRGIRAIRSLQSRLMYHDLTPCHVAHVGRRVANTGRAPVGRGDTAGGVTVYSPPLYPIILRLW